VQMLNDSVNKALQNADMRERLDALAFEPVGGSPQQSASYVKAEIAKWGKVVRDGNIKAE
jgi:tripartite-type tricarboxylate transporter receptor subunit TctC